MLTEVIGCSELHKAWIREHMGKDSFLSANESQWDFDFTSWKEAGTQLRAMFRVNQLCGFKFWPAA